MNTKFSFLVALFYIWSFIFWSQIAFSFPSTPPNNPGLLDQYACSNRAILIDTYATALSNHSATKLSEELAIWPLSDELSLVITICDWALDPKAILAVLTAAERTVGKRPAQGLVQERFTQKVGKSYNTLAFEVRPASTRPSHLTWDHVGEVLGENGLPKFFETGARWHTIFFMISKNGGGQLGSGSIKRWWQLGQEGSTTNVAAARTR